jgi:hypothetical protein
MNIGTERESVVGIVSYKKVNSPYTNMEKMGKGVLPFITILRWVKGEATKTMNRNLSQNPNQSLNHQYQK